MDAETRALLPAMMEAREQFMTLVDELRPELHRYCARMTGSVFDGEDVVQDTLAKAYYALGQMLEPPNLKPWLFRIAHNTALDFLRRYERKHVDFVSDLPERADSDETEESAVDPDLVEAALTVFVELPPLQRGALILKDVLGHSLVEIANTLGTSVGPSKRPCRERGPTSLEYPAR
jgi:RNA polymerase sigma-70 factor, ECF subfamily